MMTNVILFSEDVLIEQAARKIIATVNPNLTISSVMGGKGFSYFKKRVREIQRSATSLTFIVFLDGDELGATCPGDAIEQWFQSRSPNNIYVRFAYHEVESWLLADRANLARFLTVSEAAIPAINDQTPNTKELLIQTARRCRNRALMEDIVPQHGFSSVVGPAYNIRLTEFIQKSWNVKEAAKANNSLARACKRVSEIA